MGKSRCTASPMYRRAITLFRIVESGTPWYCSMRLDQLNRTIPGRQGFENFKQGYSSAVHWPAPILNCCRRLVLLLFLETSKTKNEEIVGLELRGILVDLGDSL